MQYQLYGRTQNTGLSLLILVIQTIIQNISRFHRFFVVSRNNLENFEYQELSNLRDYVKANYKFCDFRNTIAIKCAYDGRIKSINLSGIGSFVGSLDNSMR